MLVSMRTIANGCGANHAFFAAEIAAIRFWWRRWILGTLQSLRAKGAECDCCFSG